ncbi:hypothetical protein LIER_39967 [Lithospermum erythrorhizon]|uniref:Uncharacterized protein n=1 Tax=Lithospermum erythrorhizon TaxID=34254 RepID=A0AAV3QMT8_LITER
MNLRLTSERLSRPQNPKDCWCTIVFFFGANFLAHLAGWELEAGGSLANLFNIEGILARGIVVEGGFIAVAPRKRGSRFGDH